MGGPAPRDRLQRHDLLETAAGLADGWSLGKAAPVALEPAAWGRADRLLTRVGRQRLGASGFGGSSTGPNPTDRRKLGSKHHLVVEAHGIPLATILTGANRHDSTQLIPLIDAIGGKIGAPLRKPACVVADRGYDCNDHRMTLSCRSIRTRIARRGTTHGSGLGQWRWPVERTISWLHQFRRLRVRWERRAEMHNAFLRLGCAIICWRMLRQPFC